MSTMNTPISVQSIATVRHGCADDEVSKRRRELVSQIEVHPQFVPALRGIASYSHLIVLFWMDRATQPENWLCHPRGDTSIAETGVLASRGRNHPNPIGLAVVELLKLDGNCLTVKRLDAYDGTPVIDIKPYDDYDVVASPRVPEWFRQRQNRGKS